MAVDLEIQGAIKRTKKGGVDWYEGGGEEAWQSLEIALQNIPNAVRVGKTIKVWVNGVIREYWWETANIEDLDIRVKITPVSDTPEENGKDAFSTGGAYTKFTEIDNKLEIIEDNINNVSTTDIIQYIASDNLTNTLTLPTLIGKKVLSVHRGIPLYITTTDSLLAGQCKFTSSTGTLVFGANMYTEELITIFYNTVNTGTNPTINYVNYLDGTVTLDANVYLTSDPSTTPSVISNLADTTILTDTSNLS